MKANEELKARLWNKIMPIPHSGCWIWLGANDGRYGQLSINGRLYKTHRASYEIYIGSIPDNYLVCHKCDIPACVNPDHLFIGTMSDNIKDASDKGRNGMQKYPERSALHRAKKVRGDRHGSAKLTKRDVMRLRTLAASGAGERELGRMFGITGSHAGHIIRRKVWRHI